jgi:hypothetical protein
MIVKNFDRIKIIVREQIVRVPSEQLFFTVESYWLPKHTQCLKRFSFQCFNPTPLYNIVLFNAHCSKINIITVD